MKAWAIQENRAGFQQVEEAEATNDSSARERDCGCILSNSPALLTRLRLLTSPVTINAAFFNNLFSFRSVSFLPQTSSLKAAGDRKSAMVYFCLVKVEDVQRVQGQFILNLHEFNPYSFLFWAQVAVYRRVTQLIDTRISSTLLYEFIPTGPVDQHPPVGYMSYVRQTVQPQVTNVQSVYSVRIRWRSIVQNWMDFDENDWLAMVHSASEFRVVPAEPNLPNDPDQPSQQAVVNAPNEEEHAAVANEPNQPNQQAVVNAPNEGEQAAVPNQPNNQENGYGEAPAGHGVAVALAGAAEANGNGLPIGPIHHVAAGGADVDDNVAANGADVDAFNGH
ncbi:hypothetical protein ACH5RR_000335 [Cinchona calisaya]|uniref:Uncharacterized protein n=1 Tax=Cinchona calisaya TaxID=153742 RepID=A0ABD3B0E4_9GENT